MERCAAFRKIPRDSPSAATRSGERVVVHEVAEPSTERVESISGGNGATIGTITNIDDSRFVLTASAGLAQKPPTSGTPAKESDSDIILCVRVEDKRVDPYQYRRPFKRLDARRFCGRNSGRPPGRLGTRRADPGIRQFQQRPSPGRVTPRGDLAADEKSTIHLFQEASPSVVFITSTAIRREVIGLRVLDTPLQGTGSASSGTPMVTSSRIIT